MIPDTVMLALEFLRNPGRYPQLTDPDAPLPAGITELLAAPGQCLSDANIADTATALGATEEECRQCVPLFVKQVLLEPEGDDYRVLGLAPGADPAVLRQHYRYLIRLFHPDRNPDDEGWEDPSAIRINQAYNSLRKGSGRAGDEGSPAAKPVADTRRPARQQTTASAFRFDTDSTANKVARLSPASKIVFASVVVLVCLVFVLVVGNRERQLAPRMTESKVVANVAPAATVFTTPSDEQVQGAASSAQDAPVSSKVTTSPSGRPLSSHIELESHEAIEDKVQQRVAMARRAVLGASMPRRTTVAAQPIAVASQSARQSAPAAAVPIAPADEAARSAVSGRVPPDNDRAPTGVVLGEEAVPVSAQAGPDAEIVAKSVVTTGGEHGLAEVLSAQRQVETTGSTSSPATVLSEFVRLYESGNAHGFSDLFTLDAATTDAQGRGSIRELYADFFSQTSQRNVQINHFDWREEENKGYRGVGTAEIATQSGEGTGQRISIALEIQLRPMDGALLISELRYQPE